MTHRLRGALTAALIAASLGNAHGRDIDFGGQVRTRFEYRDPSPMGIRDNYVVLVGGAPLNEEFGKAIGADAYCRDAAVAVETATDFLARRHNIRAGAQV